MPPVWTWSFTSMNTHSDAFANIKPLDLELRTLPEKGGGRNTHLKS